MKKNVLCLGLLMTGALACFQTEAQTITAPVGTPLTITNAIDVTGGGINILTDTEFKIGSKKVISNKGAANIFVGENSGNSGITGATNTFVGINTGQSNIAGADNVFIGGNAGATNASGVHNLFLGSSAGYSNTTGGYNSFIGSGAGVSNTVGNGNVFIGPNSGRSNTSGLSNLCLGSSAGYSNTTGSYNSFLGNAAGTNNTTGAGNVFLGSNAGYTNSTGASNLFLGSAAGYANTTGDNNIFLGDGAGNTNTTGTNNTYLGKSAAGSAALTNSTAIGANAAATASNTVVLGQGATTITGTGLAGSGLRFPNLTSGSAVTSVPGGRVLSVDGSGNVVLVQLSTTPGATLSVGQPVSDDIDSKTDNSSQAFKIDDSQAKILDSKIKDLDVRLTNIAKEKNTWKEDNGFLYNNSTKGVVIKGTGFDGNALVIKGKMLSEEVNVMQSSESWPDYVFQPSYKRMSLDEVEKFISVNKHLPNVPSAAEMAITGNNLGKTDVKLLEKVEELTLYLLEMKKTNDAQSAELQSLKNQMNKLKKNRK
jgi:trimeric autotransporter adhesin